MACPRRCRYEGPHQTKLFRLQTHRSRFRSFNLRLKLSSSVSFFKFSVSFFKFSVSFFQFAVSFFDFQFRSLLSNFVLHFATWFKLSGAIGLKGNSETAAEMGSTSYATAASGLPNRRGIYRCVVIDPSVACCLIALCQHMNMHAGSNEATKLLTVAPLVG